MSKEFKNRPVEVTRRSVLLQGAACATAAAAILTVETNSAMAAKLPPNSVSYRATPKGDQKCSNCSLFEAPKSCKSVSGVISPNGWCSIYRKA
jgi:hypothetical protein